MEMEGREWSLWKVVRRRGSKGSPIPRIAIRTEEITT